MADMCSAVYDRAGSAVLCTYVKDHPLPRHSWETLKLQDEMDRTLHTFSMRGIPSDVEAVLVNIEMGRADPYLEVLLLVCHNRKKALRNVPGFSRLERQT